MLSSSCSGPRAPEGHCQPLDTGGALPAPGHQRGTASPWTPEGHCQPLDTGGALPAPGHRRGTASPWAPEGHCQPLGTGGALPAPGHRRGTASPWAPEGHYPIPLLSESLYYYIPLSQVQNAEWYSVIYYPRYRMLNGTL